MQEIELKIKNKQTKEKNSVVFEFPLSWEELSLRQFIDWYEITLDSEVNELERMIQIISVLSQKSKEEIENLPEQAFYKLAEVVTPMIEEGFPPFQPQLGKGEGEFQAEIDGVLYKWNPDYFKDNIGNIAKMEQMLTGLNLVTHFHYVLAFCLNFEGEEFDQEKLNEKAQMFLDKIQMNELYFFLFNSFTQGKTSLNFIKGFSNGEKAINQIERELHLLQNSVKDGVGSTTE